MCASRVIAANFAGWRDAVDERSILLAMTPEQLQSIRQKWSAVRRPSSNPKSQPTLADAAADIERLLREVERLRHCCDEITRQYIRLSASATRTGIKATHRSPQRTPPQLSAARPEN
ncbi:MAG TPA: hypothetical protein VFA89_03760 [Terriglobales bacterium]|nr:hypothetical protein [Terriglobales bacterium]